MNTGNDPIALSVVAPCYNEFDGLREFVRRAEASCQKATGESYEIILVDDGSTDKTWSLIETLTAASRQVIGVRLFRNHGHQLAVSAGLSVARGGRVLIIDADLQDPPEAVPEMMAIMDAGADVVYGQRISRKGETWFKLMTAFLFYRLLSRLSHVNIPQDTGDFRLISREVADILLLMPERNRFLRGMVSWIGGRQVAYPYERQPRLAGSTGYTVRKMIRFAVDALTSFSIVPLRIATWLGLMTALIAILIIGYAVYSKFAGNVVQGWTSAVAASAFFASIQLIVLGVMGEYLGRLVEEQKQRPLFMIKCIKIGNRSVSIPHQEPACRPADIQSILANFKMQGTAKKD